MNYLNEFEICGASCTGASHRKKSINNQDSHKIFVSDDLIIGVVSDGCSAGGDVLVRSDVGSALLCELTITCIIKLKKHIGSSNFFQLLFDEVCDSIFQHAKIFSLDSMEYIHKYLQATVLGCIVWDGRVYIFSCGDGVYFLNQKWYTLAAQENNAPIYLAYKFIPTTFSPDILQSELRFHLHQSINYQDFENLLIGTDGVEELIDAKDNLIHVRNEPIGDISQWWTKDLYFRNSFAPHNWLKMMNDPANSQGGFGLLQDDVTLIALRKKSQ